MKKKVIMLGGSDYQAIAVKRAREMGVHTILLDYNSKCPGRKFADEYEQISTTDGEKIIKTAQKYNVDGIVCYESDQSIETASWVCKQLGLPGQPYESVKILQNKALFRKFLSQNNFNCPKSKVFQRKADALIDAINEDLPFVVKPSDSCGSLGVTVVQDVNMIKTAIEHAYENSKRREIIIEEYIDKSNFQLDGDAFSINGELAFLALGNQHHLKNDRYKLYVMGISFPSIEKDEVIREIEKEVSRLFKLLNMKSGPYNIEVMIDKNGKVYIMECSPRNGGNLIPEVLIYQRGFDMIEATIRVALGEVIDVPESENLGFYSSFILRNNKSGIIKSFTFEHIKDNIVEFRKYYGAGMAAPEFHKACGAMILRYDSEDEMLSKMELMNEYVRIEVE